MSIDHAGEFQPPPPEPPAEPTSEQRRMGLQEKLTERFADVTAGSPTLTAFSDVSRLRQAQTATDVAAEHSMWGIIARRKQGDPTYVSAVNEAEDTFNALNRAYTIESDPHRDTYGNPRPPIDAQTLAHVTDAITAVRDAQDSREPLTALKKLRALASQLQEPNTREPRPIDQRALADFDGAIRSVVDREAPTAPQRLQEAQDALAARVQSLPPSSREHREREAFGDVAALMEAERLAEEAENRHDPSAKELRSTAYELLRKMGEKKWRSGPGDPGQNYADATADARKHFGDLNTAFYRVNALTSSDILPGDILPESVEYFYKAVTPTSSEQP